MGARLYERELQESLDFCVKLFSATSPESHSQLLDNPSIGQQLLDLTAPVVAPDVLEKALHVVSESRSNGSEESARMCDSNEKHQDDTTRMVLEKINARRVLHPEYTVNGFEAEALEGFTIRLERGSLGLNKAVSI